MKKTLVRLFAVAVCAFTVMPSFAVMNEGIWTNDARTMFTSNQSVILAINIRTFNAKDKNKNDIIEPEKGEEKGSFYNAIGRLNEIKKQGINTIHILPVTPVGKIKAMGTAGSLYAISDFTKLNPQLDDPNNNLSVYDEAKLFIKECHRRNIRVIFDLPSCGSYDLYLSNPDLFEKDESGQPLVPADWTDVRLFKVQNSDGSLNDDVYLLYKNYIDFVQKLGVDGIRADVATSKPYEFWESLISYARQKDSEFLFLAEASESWTEPIAKEAPFTPYYKLLEAGFDGWYGSFFSFKDWTPEKFEKEMSLIQSIRKDFEQKKQPKAVIGSFATHDEPSPIITGGMPYSNMIIWLQSTLPINSYYVDGFQSGDSYQYSYANQKAENSQTDDEYYYVHKGKFDIFNYSRKPGGHSSELLDNFEIGNKLKIMSTEILDKGTFEVIKTDNPSVLAYTYSYKATKTLVVANKDFVHPNSVKFTIKDFDTAYYAIVPIYVASTPIIDKKVYTAALSPGETQVFVLQRKDIQNNQNTKPRAVKKYN